MGIEGIKYICIGYCFILKSVTSFLVFASLKKNNMRVTHRNPDCACWTFSWILERYYSARMKSSVIKLPFRGALPVVRDLQSLWSPALMALHYSFLPEVVMVLEKMHLIHVQSLQLSLSPKFYCQTCFCCYSVVFVTYYYIHSCPFWILSSLLIPKFRKTFQQWC